MATTRTDTTRVATTKDGDLLCGYSDRVLGSTACNKDGNSADLSMPSARPAHLNSLMMQETLQKSGLKVQKMLFNAKILIRMYVYTLTHLHLVSVGLTQVHPNDYNYT